MYLGWTPDVSRAIEREITDGNRDTSRGSFEHVLWPSICKGIKTVAVDGGRGTLVPGTRRLQFDSCRLVPNNSDNYALLISPRLFRSD